ncbi:hypothetical protein [Neisseria perflava]|uniref:hypothetical protein n=1 Tax=Neisseria perflava TaxID=33053 RepID=UPI00209FCB60|nr:hypothetical protein [Neisseria perflava]MCP1661320.1 hypothetical protein [Neisseria perflava]
MKAWFDKIGTPTTLAQVGVTGEVLEAVLDNAAQNAVDWQMSDIYSRKAIAEVLALAE